MDTIYGPALYMNSSGITTVVKAGAGNIFGVMINSHSSGTLKFYDSASSASLSTVIYNTITPAAGSGIFINTQGVTFSNGLIIIRGGTADFTVHYR